MSSQAEIVAVVGLIGAAYPNFAATKETVGVYYELLKDLPFAELKLATMQCCAEAGRKFAPSIGELRGAVQDLRRASLNIPSAYDAWQEVLRAFTDRIGYDAPEWSTPLIAKVVKSLGWRNLCMSENQVADRARFIQAYEQLIERAEKESMLIPEVRGYLESNGARMLDAGSQMKQLTERFSK